MATELPGDMRFGSLLTTVGAAPDAVLLEDWMTRVSWPGPDAPANRFFAAAGRVSRVFPVAAARTAEAVTGFPAALITLDATNMLLPLAKAEPLAADAALFEISMAAAGLPAATTDDRDGAAAAVSEAIS